MKVAVLNGSPKGKYSTTLQSVLYLCRKYPEDSFRIVETASAIKSLEKDFSPVMEAVSEADIILFSYPVYTFLVPYQLHRAVELLKERCSGLEGKCVVQITTSKHFYDVTAHRFIEDNARDMGLEYLHGLSADMDDLLTENGRRQLLSFWNLVRFKYMRVQGAEALHVPEEEAVKYEAAIVTDDRDNPLLRKMSDIFASRFPGRTRIVDISAFPFKGGCISCFRCAASGECIYKDGYSDFLRREIHSASAVIYAFKVKDHSMGSRFKLFDDRQFCNGHRMMTIGMPVGYLVDGDMEREPNLKMMMEARAEVARNILCGIVSGAGDADMELRVENMASLVWFTLVHKTSLPQNFFGVGGTRIFRDLIWIMRGLMKADHKFYKKHGIYDDMPHRHIGKMLQGKLIGWMFNSPSIRRKMGAKLNEGMIAPYRKAIEK